MRYFAIYRACCKTRLVLHRLLQFFSGCCCKTKVLQQPLEKENKNNLFKKTRKFFFEQIILSIEQKQVVDVIENPNQEKYKGYCKTSVLQ
jgi:hypothetical protein